MSNGNGGPGHFIVPQDRVFERARGCWNCKHYDHGDLARQHWQTCRGREVANQIANGNVHLLSATSPEALEFEQTLKKWDQGVTTGTIGMCLAGGVDTDFVDQGHLCAKWCAAGGASLATEGAKLDLLPEELKVRAEEKVKKPL